MEATLHPMVKEATSLSVLAPTKVSHTQITYHIIHSLTVLDIPGPALLSSMTNDSSAKGTLTPNSSSNPLSQFSSFASPSTSQSATPQPQQQQQQPATDPFAFFNTPKPAASPAPAPTSQAPSQPAADDDEWNFSSALPETSSRPKEHRATVHETQIKTEMVANRHPTAPAAITISFAFSNTTAQPISELHFQLAVTKVRLSYPLAPIHLTHTPGLTHTNISQGFELALQPQTGRDLTPKQSRGVTQTVQVFASGNRTQKVESVKLRWRASYKVGGEQKNEMGEIAEFGIA